MIGAIASVNSGASPTDFAAQLTQLRSLHANLQSPAGVKTTQPKNGIRGFEELTEMERNQVENARAHGFARKYAMDGSQYVQRIWWG